jgi:hypothetical protein
MGALHLKQVPEHPFDLILVERLDLPNSKPLWLLWVGQDKPNLDELWQQYLRRFQLSIGIALSVSVSIGLYRNWLLLNRWKLGQT